MRAGGEAGTKALMRSLLLFVLLATSACASFESGDLPHLDGWPPRPVAATQHARIEMNGLPDKFSWWPERTRAVFAASGRFDGVRVGTTGAPESSHAPRHEVLVRFDVRHDRPDGLPLTRAMMLVCALSAATIPARSVHPFDVRATFHDSAGKMEGAAFLWAVVEVFPRRVPFATSAVWEIYRPKTNKRGCWTSSVAWSSCAGRTAS